VITVLIWKTGCINLWLLHVIFYIISFISPRSWYLLKYYTGAKSIIFSIILNIW
jgi:hypothetical protein